MLNKNTRIVAVYRRVILAVKTAVVHWRRQAAIAQLATKPF
jgi:hypothetical protein